MLVGELLAIMLNYNPRHSIQPQKAVTLVGSDADLMLLTLEFDPHTKYEVPLSSSTLYGVLTAYNLKKLRIFMKIQ